MHLAAGVTHIFNSDGARIVAAEMVFYLAPVVLLSEFLLFSKRGYPIFIAFTVASFRVRACICIFMSILYKQGIPTEKGANICKIIRKMYYATGIVFTL